MGRIGTVLAVCLVTITACTPSFAAEFSVAPAPAENMALLYLFSSDSFRVPLGDIEVNMNSKPFARITRASYSWAYLRPGKYVVTTEYAPSFEFEIAAGESGALYLSALPFRGHGSPLSMFGLLGAVAADATQSSSPLLWGYLNDVAKSSRYPELTKRAFQAPIGTEFEPSP